MENRTMDRNILFTEKMIEEEAKEYMKGAKKFPHDAIQFQTNRKYNFEFFIFFYFG